MAKIKYDQMVISIAEKIVKSPTATRGDILRLIRMSDHIIPHVRKEKNLEMMPRTNYLGRETRTELLNLAHSLPSRIRK